MMSHFLMTGIVLVLLQLKESSSQFQNPNYSGGYNPFGNIFGNYNPQQQQQQQNIFNPFGTGNFNPFQQQNPNFGFGGWPFNNFQQQGQQQNPYYPQSNPQQGSNQAQQQNGGQQNGGQQNGGQQYQYPYQYPLNNNYFPFANPFFPQYQLPIAPTPEKTTPNKVPESPSMSTPTPSSSIEDEIEVIHSDQDSKHPSLLSTTTTLSPKENEGIVPLDVRNYVSPQPQQDNDNLIFQ